MVWHTRFTVASLFLPMGNAVFLTYGDHSLNFVKIFLHVVASTSYNQIFYFNSESFDHLYVKRGCLY